MVRFLLFLVEDSVQESGEGQVPLQQLSTSPLKEVSTPSTLSAGFTFRIRNRQALAAGEYGVKGAAQSKQSVEAAQR